MESHDTGPVLSPLPRASLADVGIDPRGVLNFIGAQESAGQDTTSFVLIRGGRVCAEAHWRPYGPEDCRHVYSVTKSFTSAAIGMAVEAGALSYDDRIVDLLAEHIDPAQVGRRAAAIRVRDCLGMATGHTADLPKDPAHLSRPWSLSLRPLLIPEPQAKLGTFNYTNLASYTLAALVELTTGENCASLLDRRLCQPLGVDAIWQRDRLGRPLGFTGLRIRPIDLALLTQVIADGGTRDGTRLLPQEWVTQAPLAHTNTRTPGGPDPDWQCGYGWQIWRNRSGFRLDGAYGQFAVVLPEQDLVVVVTEGAMNTQRTLEHIWAHLVPACDRAATAHPDDVDEALAQRRFNEPGATAGPARAATGTPVGDRVELRTQDGAPTLRWVDAVDGDVPLGIHDWVRSRLSWPQGALDVAGICRVDGDNLVATVAVLSEPHLIDVHADLHSARPPSLRWRTTPMDTQGLRDLAL